MERAVLAFRSGRLEKVTSRCSVIAALRQHARDPVYVASEDAAGVSFAWLGHPADPADRPDGIDVPRLARALQEQDDRYLRNLLPPFCAAVQTSNPAALWLLGDRFGLHPTYYAVQDGTLAFCSKLSPLLRSGLVHWGLDRRAIVDFFTYEHVTGDRTFADRIRVLPPATVLRFVDGAFGLHPYAEFEFGTQCLSVAEIAEALHAELDRSVADSVRHAQRVAITLSGGLDSRALLGCAVRHSSGLRTYTFGAPGCPEMRSAREVAHRAGVPNTAVEIDGAYLRRWLDHGIHVTGGMVSCTQYHITILADLLAEEADVVLDGLGGDALTGVHLKPAMFAARSAGRATSPLYRQRATAWAGVDERRRIFEPDFLTDDTYDPREAVDLHVRETEEPWRACHRFDLLERQRRFVQFGPHQIRPFVTVQTPFYAPGVVDLLTGAAARHLLGQRAYVRMHARHLRSLAGVPDSARGVPLTWPLGVRFAKQAVDFAGRRARTALRRSRAPAPEAPVDYGGWFRGDLRGFVEERLLDGGAFGGVLRRDEVEAVLREHNSGGGDHTGKVACLLTFEGWLRSVKAG